MQKKNLLNLVSTAVIPKYLLPAYVPSLLERKKKIAKEREKKKKSTQQKHKQKGLHKRNFKIPYTTFNWMYLDTTKKILYPFSQKKICERERKRKKKEFTQNKKKLKISYTEFNYTYRHTKLGLYSLLTKENKCAPIITEGKKIFALIPFQR